MTSYKLTYFDVDGGRAESIRISLHAAGIEFEDRRISFQEFGESREGFPFNCVPVLEIDGAPVSQSNALSRYAGKKAGLYPEDEIEALYCDEVLGASEDLTNHIGRTIGLDGEALKEARAELVAGWLTVFLKGLEGLLQRGGGEYFADGRLTIADLKVYSVTGWLCSGMLEHVPVELINELAPGLVEHRKRVHAHPTVKAWYEARKVG